MLAAVLTTGRIRDLLRKARDAEGLTLDELAEASGVDRMIVHRLENTKTYPEYEPGLTTVLKVIAGLRGAIPDVPVDAERLPDLITAAIRNTLPSSPTGTDNPGPPTKGPNGDQLSQTSVDRLSDAIGLLGDEIINALNRINTTFSSVDRRLADINTQLESLRARRDADHEQAAAGGTHPSRQRTRGAPRTRKTG